MIMNDMMPTIEETLTPDVDAQLEHERGERERERAEIWAALEAQHGPLHFRNGRFEYAEYEGMAWKD